MTNNEKYKQAFSAIHISDDFSLEVNKMATISKKMKLTKLIASVAACVLIVGSATAVYAADVGGIQRTIQLWRQGEKTDVTIQFDGSGNYEMDYVDEEGNRQHQGGGGIAYDGFGNERPLTAEELMEEMNSPEVIYLDDGSVWVYWYNQKIDITDKFENGVCYIKLVNGDEILYMTAKYQDGWSTSPHKFSAP